jgi:hypothetical protein
MNKGMRIAGVILGAVCVMSPAAAQFTPFKDFLDASRAADSRQFTRTDGTGVRDAAAFEEMRSHIVKLYEGVEVKHSFVEDSDHFDCVPVAQQPFGAGAGAEGDSRGASAIVARGAAGRTAGRLQGGSRWTT